MRIELEPDVFARLDHAVETKIAEAIIEWRRSGSDHLRLGLVEAAQVRMSTRAAVPGALWN